MEAGKRRNLTWAFVLCGTLLVVATLRADESAIRADRYVFSPEQSTIVQTGGFAGVHWTYSVEGQFCLIVDPNAGSARFEQLDANAVDVSEPARTLDPNAVFNLTALASVIANDAIEFTGQTADGSTVGLTLAVEGNTVRLTGETTPPPNSADFFVFAIDAVAARKYAGGTGDPHTPYQIATAEQMNAIGTHPDDWNKHFLLTVDIDLSASGCSDFNAIGYSRMRDQVPFTGVFDGGGHTISRLTCTEGGGGAMFVYIHNPNAEIKNIGLVDPNVSGVAALVGHLRSGTVRNCYVQGGTVTSTWDAAGLVAVNSGAIVNCYSATCVTGVQSAGGLVAYNYGDVINCYSVSAVTGDWNAGGLICFGEGSGTVFQSFWNVETSGQTTSAGGVGMTTSEMQMGKTYLGWATCGNEGIWTIDEGNDYPRLWWEGRAGQDVAAVRLSDFLVGTGTSDDPYLIRTVEDSEVIDLFPCEWDKEFRLMFVEGEGTAERPYIVHTAEQLGLVSLCVYEWDAHFRLMADIDLSSYPGDTFNIIGNDQRPFVGVFDGNGHAIAHLTRRSQGQEFVGMFGYVAGAIAEIRNLALLEPDIDASEGNCIGAMVGHLAEGNVANCHVVGGHVSGDGSVGAVVGDNQGTVQNCSSSCAVTGGSPVGGLVGDNAGTVIDCNATSLVTGDDCVGGLVGRNVGTIADSSTLCDITGDVYVGGVLGLNGLFTSRDRDCAGDVVGCRSHGSVTGKSVVGGLVGYNFKDSTIATCCSTGTVDGFETIGGLAGSSFSSIIDCYSKAVAVGTQQVGGLIGYRHDGIVTNCYSTGHVSGQERVGGLVGWNSGGSFGVFNSFWDIETSGQKTSPVGRGLTTAQMQTAATYLDAGWDFVGETANGTEDIWWIDEGRDYPRLWWEAEELIIDD
jgi:hypothetical protein